MTGQEVFADVPWLLPVLKTALGAAVLWILAAPFARWLLVLINPVVDGLGVAVRSRHASNRHRSLERRVEIDRKRLRLGDQKQTVDVTAVTLWRRAITDARSSIEQTMRALHEQTASQKSLSDGLKTAQRRFERLSSQPHSVPDISNEAALVRHDHLHRAASLRFYGSLFFLVVAAFANATLSNRVFRELGISGQSPFGPSVPLSFVVAVALVFVEVTIGWLHGMASDRESDDERRLTVGQIGWSLAGLAVIGFETWLYSLVVPPELSGRESVLGIPPAAAFALLGAILGAALYGLGNKLYSARVAKYRSHTPRSFFRQVQRLRHSIDDLKTAMEHLYARQVEISKAFKSEDEKNHAATAIATVTKVHQQFQQYEIAPPPWSRPTSQPMTIEDLDEREGRWLLWTALAIVGSVASTFAWTALMPWSGFPAVGAALGITLAFLSAGFVLVTTIVPDVKTELSLRDELQWSRRATLLAALTPAVLPTVVVLVAILVEGGWRSLWILTLPTAAFLVVVGRELGGLIAFFPIRLATIASHIAAVVDVLISGVLWIFVGALTVLKAALYLVAAPVLGVWALPRRSVQTASIVSSSIY